MKTSLRKIVRTRAYIVAFTSLTLAAGTMIGCGGTGAKSTSATSEVGRTVVEWTDSARIEKFGPTAGTPRRIMAYVWYPANPAKDAKKGPFLPESQAEVVAPALGTDKAKIMSLPTNSYMDAPLTLRSGALPVILMSHGNGNMPLNYTSTAEYLAARGYVVVGISHTYNARFTGFKDGTVLPSDVNAMVEGVTPQIRDNSSFADHDANWKASCDLNAELAKDVPFVIQQLGQLNSADARFQGRLALGRIGMFGHSYGGAMSFRMLREDSRIAAAADLDGSVYDTKFADGVKKPFLLFQGKRASQSEVDSLRATFIQQGMSASNADTLLARFSSDENAFLKSSPAYAVKLKKALHGNFTDDGLWQDYGFPTDQVSTEATPASLLKTTHEYLTAFFDETIKGEYSPMLHQAKTGDIELRIR